MLSKSKIKFQMILSDPTQNKRLKRMTSASEIKKKSSHRRTEKNMHD